MGGGGGGGAAERDEYGVAEPIRRGIAVGAGCGNAREACLVRTPPWYPAAPPEGRNEAEADAMWIAPCALEGLADPMLRFDKRLVPGALSCSRS